MKELVQKAWQLTILTTMVFSFYGISQEAGASTEEAPDAIQMTARKYEFNPNVITVKKGQKVRLIITAQDRDHGFQLRDFGIDQRLIKGVLTHIEFTAYEVGTFPFKCSVRCGRRHGKMKGKLIVEEDLP